MNHSAELRRCLEDCDIVGIKRLWAHIAPHLPQPASDSDALTIIHHARTQAQSIRLSLRFYSHSWLCERGMPSGLPNELRPRAEQIFPIKADAVGIAVRPMRESLRPAALAIRSAMEQAVLTTLGDGVIDPVVIKDRMMEARDRERRGLGI